MIPGTTQELMDESQIFTAGWQFMKKYANPVTDEDWTEVIQAAKEFPEAFGDSKFAKHMIISIVMQIERNYKAKLKAQEDQVA